MILNQAMNADCARECMPVMLVVEFHAALQQTDLLRVAAIRGFILLLAEFRALSRLFEIQLQAQ
jgi:hypothetical protein